MILALRTLSASAISAMVLGTSPVLAAGSGSTNSPADVITPIENYKWTQPFGPEGPELSVVYGDTQKGPNGVIFRFKPGFDSGWHTHDNAYSAVVIQGSHMHLVQGETTSKALAAGSYFTQQGKGNHSDRCVSETPCLLFAHNMGPMSYTPKTADGKDVPAPAK